MNTKICSGCGWVYPIDAPGTKCKICGTPFEIVKCRVCGKVVSGKDRVPNRAQCKPCHNAEERKSMERYRAKRNKAFEDRYNEWLARIAKVPKDYPTLTEAQWMRACKHFNKCAKCGDENIEARGFFISFENGGRYCDWNVIPLCNKCASDRADDINPFRLAWSRDNMSRAFNRRECLEEVVKYLGDILDGI